MVHRLHTKCRLTKNRTKSRVRSKVEHVFAVMKLKFGFVKLGYRGAEECHPTVRGVRAGESVLGAEKTVALGTGLARERRLLITGEPPKQAEDRKKPNPSACTGLAEHLLPRRHGLIQSFPSCIKRIASQVRPPANHSTDCCAPQRSAYSAGRSNCRRQSADSIDATHSHGRPALPYFRAALKWPWVRKRNRQRLLRRGGTRQRSRRWPRFGRKHGRRRL